MKEILKDGLWIFTIVLSVIAIFLAVSIYSKIYNTTNNDRVITQFFYQGVIDCNEKLAAYGEDVDLNILKEDITVESLNNCLDKLDTLQ